MRRRFFLGLSALLHRVPMILGSCIDWLRLLVSVGLVGIGIGYGHGLDGGVVTGWAMHLLYGLIRGINGIWM